MMSLLKRLAIGCVVFPVLLVASCVGKISYDQKRYILPGEVMKSSVAPTRKLETALQVATALDAYVQPRFEILRDKNFGAFRIVYRQHAGIVQLKVDTEQEKMLIANVNATNRDYAISLLHCAPKPYHANSGKPKLQMLYFNQQQNTSDQVQYGGIGAEYIGHWAEGRADEKGLDCEAIEKKAISALTHLMKGKEQKTEDAHWQILMRPVLAAKPECLSCHTDAKLGDTLGVMVYAVREGERSLQARNFSSSSSPPERSR